MATAVAEPVPMENGEPGSSNRPQKPEKRVNSSMLTGDIIKDAAIESLRKLDPRTLWRNTVMFVVEVGAVLTTILFIGSLTGANDEISWFGGWITAWLWFTVLFANFAEAIAEGRGKAQADTLRKTRKDTKAKVLVDGDASRIEERASNDL